MEGKRPLILVTNDDSISAKGIHSLWETALKFGDVVVIAPDSPQSGMGHAITINEPLRVAKVSIFGETDGYSCSGTPVDCVKLGVCEILDRRPDLIVSGINHGANYATNVLYSGTMSAAVEGAMEEIPSIGFSLCSFDPDADFSVAQKVVEEVMAQVLETGLQRGVCLNVNIPYVKAEDFKGIKVCRQAPAHWEDRFDRRKDQFDRPYFWMTGQFKDNEQKEDTDIYWIDKGYASIVPTQFDMTAYSAMNELENWKL